MEPILYLLVYALAGLSGIAMAARVSLLSPLGRVLIVCVFGATQILFCVQVTSLWHGLSAVSLAVSGAFVTGVTLWLVRLPFTSLWRGWPRLSWRPAMAFLRDHPLASLVLLCSVGLTLTLAIISAQVIPIGDSYHFTMPLYWHQHSTVLPFPTSNPRVTGLSFGSEALCYPAVWAFRSFAPFCALSAAAKGMLIWMVAFIALRCGASLPAAVTAGALSLLYTPLQQSMPDLIFPCFWVGAAIVLLLLAKEEESRLEWCLGCSVAAMLLGCGSKNVVSLQAPAYLLFVLWLFGRRLFKVPALRALALGGFGALLCSSTLWTYVSNRVWFGDFRGSQVIKETVAEDYHASAVWTRVARGSVNSFIDPIWLPKSLHPAYERLLKGTIGGLGGRQDLPEDDEYYSFTRECLRPGTGLGLLGIMVFAPGLLLGLVKGRGNHGALVAGSGRPIRALAAALALLTLGCFLASYVALRTQRGGTTRLMGSCVIVGAPLAALLFEARWARAGVLLPMVPVLGSSLVLFAGQLTRRSSSPSWFGRQIGKLQNNHVLEHDCFWTDLPPQKITIREDYTSREYYETFLRRVPAGVSCAFVGAFNSEEEHLFGPHFRNRVFPLRDYRQPAPLQPVPAEVQYIVTETGEYGDLDQAALGFELWLEVWHEGKPIFGAWKRRAAPVP